MGQPVLQGSNERSIRADTVVDIFWAQRMHPAISLSDLGEAAGVNHRELCDAVDRWKTRMRAQHRRPRLRVVE